MNDSKTPVALGDEAIAEALSSLAGWSHEADALKKSFRFKDFREAIAFLVRVAFEAEQRGHHPELFNVYNRVEITLRTHDIGDRVSELDLELARAIESVVG